MAAIADIVPFQLFILLFFIAILRFVAPFISGLLAYVSYPHFVPIFRKVELWDSPSTMQKASIGEVESLGFTPAIWFEVIEPDLTHQGVMFSHPTTSVFAALHFVHNPYAGYRVVFYTFLRNGTTLFTANRLPGAAFADAKLEAHDPFADNLPSHLQAHMDRIKDKDALSLTPDEAFSRIVALAEISPAELAAQGQLTQDKSGNWFRTLPVAARASWTLVRKQRKLRKPYQTVLTSEAYQSAYYAQCYREQEIWQKRRKSRTALLFGLLMVSAVISLGLWSLLFDTSFAFMLIGIILVHECGHGAAMRYFGYRDMSMFVIPFAGAVVTGSIKNLPAWKQAIVLLAGPLPGLLFGIWVIHAYMFSDSPLLYQLGTYAFYINLFNLLPITPLDGGRLIEISLVARWPKAIIIFAVLSLIASLGLAVWLESPTLYIIAYFLVMYVRSQYRMTQIRAEWKSSPGEDSQLERLFQIVGQKFAKIGFVRRYQVARAIFSPPSISLPRLWETSAVLAIFFVIWGCAGYLIYDWNRYELLQKQFDAAYDAFTDDESDPGSATKDALLKDANKAANALYTGDPRRVDLEVAISWSKPTPERNAILENLLKKQRGGYIEPLNSIARFYLTDIHNDVAQKDGAERQRVLTEAITKVDALAPMAYPGTIGGRLWLAEAYDAQSKSDIAKKQLSELLEKTKNIDSCHCAQAEVTGAFAWFYIEKHQPENAIKLLENSPYAKEMKENSGRLGLEYAWALLESGQTKAGLDQMLRANTTKARKTTTTVNSTPRRIHSMDLAYAYLIAGKTTDEALSVAPEQDDMKWYCKYLDGKFFVANEPWQKRHREALGEAMTKICRSLSELDEKGVNCQKPVSRKIGTGGGT